MHRLISGRHTAVGALADFQGASDERTETRMLADYRDCRPANVKMGYPLDAFNPVIIETISFLSVCFV